MLLIHGHKLHLQEWQTSGSGMRSWFIKTESPPIQDFIPTKAVYFLKIKSFEEAKKTDPLVKRSPKQCRSGFSP